MHLKNAPRVWSTLVGMYEVRSAANKHAVQQKFFNFKYDERQGARENVARLNGLTAECRVVGIEIDVQSAISKLLNTLPDRYEPLIYSFETKREAEQTLEALTNMLVQKEAFESQRKTTQERKKPAPPVATELETQAALLHKVRNGHAQSAQRPHQPNRPHQNNNGFRGNLS